MSNYYQILGLDATATDAEIKKAYRKLAQKFHPDKKDGNEEKFKEISEAYNVLGNPEKRKEYDQPRRSFDGDFTGFSGFEDMFSSMFGGRRSTKASSPICMQASVDTPIAAQAAGSIFFSDRVKRKSSTKTKRPRFRQPESTNVSSDGMP